MRRHRRSNSASFIGGIAETQQVHAICAEHRLLPEEEVIPLQDLNKAYDKLLD